MMELKLPPQDSTRDLANIFKLLSDETRLRILFLLQQTPEINVLELCRRLEQRQPSVSHHLRLLRSAGIIRMRRAGKHNFYRFCPERLEEMSSTVSAASPESPLGDLLEQLKRRCNGI
jgi:ArsR family transcriptional regulator